MRVPSPFARLLSIAALWLLADAVRVRADDERPCGGAAAGGADLSATDVGLRTPIPPADPAPSERGVGLRGLDRNGDTLAAVVSDGRIYVRSGPTERFVDPPAGGEVFRSLAVAGDGVPVAVTTHGHVFVIEATGLRQLPLDVQRSARPVSIPGSIDVVLASENGSIRRLVRGAATPRWIDVVERGDEPVGVFAASATRVVYARLDGRLLSIEFASDPAHGEPSVLLRPTLDVRSICFVQNEAYAAIGDELVALGAGSATRPSAPARSSDAPRAADIDAADVSPDGTSLALLQGGVVEVRRLADGRRVRTDALLARRPTSLAWSADGRSLLVATQLDARPWRIPVDPAAAPPAAAAPAR